MAAQTQNDILLKITFDGQNAVKTTTELRLSIEKLKVEQKVLEENLKTGNITIKDAEQKQTLLNAKLKEAQREYREVTKFVNDTTAANRAQIGSIEGNRIKLSQLTAEYVKAGKPTAQQTAQIKALSDTLKKQESAIGDTRRNVGNYADALTNLKGPIGGAINGFNGFNAALAANPIGAIVALLVPLIQQLLKLKPVADFLEAAFAGLAAGFDAFTSSIGKFLSGDFSGAFSGFSDTISNAVKNANDLTKAMQNLNDQERQVSTISSHVRTEIDKLLLQSKNRTLSEAERIKFLEQASKLEEDVLKLESDNAKERLRIEGEKNKAILKTRQLTDEEDQRRVDAQLKLDDINRASIVLQEKIQNRKDELASAAEKKAQDAADAEQQRLDKALEAEKKFREQLAKIQHDFNQEIFDIKKENKKEQENLDKQDIERQSKQIDEEVNLSKNRAEARKQIADAEVALESAKFDAIQSLVGLAQSVAGKNTQLQILLFGIEKALAIAQIIINLQRERSANAVAGAAINAATLGTAGNAFIAINNTISAIRAGVGIATIVATAIPQIKAFKDGGEFGYTGDGSPSSESTNLGVKPYKYHKREYIVPDKVLSTPEGKHHVGILESMRRATPSNLSYLGGYADGGFASRAFAENVSQALQFDDLANIFQSMPVPIVRVSEIERVSSNKSNSVKVSEL